MRSDNCPLSSLGAGFVGDIAVASVVVAAVVDGEAREMLRSGIEWRLLTPILKAVLWQLQVPLCPSFVFLMFLVLFLILFGDTSLVLLFSAASVVVPVCLFVFHSVSIVDNLGTIAIYVIGHACTCTFDLHLYYILLFH